MYKIVKDKGYKQNVILQNTDTKSSLIVGPLNMDILSILRKDGYKFNEGEGTLMFTDAWELEISSEVKEELSGKAMRMKKPIRNQSDNKEKSKDLFKKPNKKIDAMDVLLGLANYN